MNSLILPIYEWVCIECITGGHGRCVTRECSCDCHDQLASLEALQQMANEWERRVERFNELVIETLEERR